MAVSTTANKVVYSGTGSQTIFPFTFSVLEADDLQVVLVDADGNETTQVRGVDYTLTPASNDFSNGGNVVMSVAPGATEELVIYRLLDLTQETDYEEGDSFPAETHEQALDRLTMIAQQLEEKFDRVLQVPLSELALPSLPYKTARANKFLGFNTSGDPVAVSGMVLSTNLRPYLIAAYDASTEWKEAAQAEMASGEDLMAKITNLIDNGISSIVLSPGTFDVSSTLEPSGAETLFLRGQGNNTILKATQYINKMINLNALTTGWAFFRDFLVDDDDYINNTSCLYGNGGVTQELWENITVNAKYRGFQACWHISHCHVYLATLTIAGASGFNSCRYVDDCHVVYDGTSGTQSAKGFYNSKYLTNCSVELMNLGAIDGHVGFDDCIGMTDCYVSSDKSGGTSGSLAGFFECENLTTCYAYYIGYHGFNGCKRLSSCVAYDCEQYGFYSCEQLSSCYAANCDVGGFLSCDYLVTCYADDNWTYGFASCNHCVTCHARSNATAGFYQCTQCQQCYSHDTQTADYSASYADQNSNACANTAAGGYNR